MNTRTTTCRLLITTLVATLASACGGGGGSGSDPIDVPAVASGSSSPQITGSVTKGPLDSSDLEFLPIDAFGLVRGAAVATATTNADGSFSVTIPAGSGDLLIRTSGGTYVDEADREPDPALKRRIVLNPGEGLESLLLAGSSTASVTLATHALLNKTRRETQGATFMQQFAANRELAISAIGFDIIATQPANPVLPDPGMAEEQRQYAMVLGGLANLINRVSINADMTAPTIDSILAVADDFSDGRIDGMMDGVPVIVAGVPIVAFSLNEEITRFRNNNFNNYSGTGLVTVDEDVFSQSAVPINALPVGAADSYALTTGETLTVAAPGVLDNDTDADGNPLTAELVPGSGPANASQFSFSPDGAFSYTHDGSGPTVDGFSYVVTDGLGTSGPVAVTLNVLNTPPVANDDTETVEEGGLLAAGSVLLNDTDANGDTLTAILVDLPANGQLLFNPDGTYEYTHDGSETTSDQFTYAANDGNDDSLPATVVITVTPVNDPPVANPDSISVDQGGIVTVLDSGAITVLANDTDMDNPVNTLVALIVDPPVNGQLVLMSDGTFSYEHNDSETTTDSFIYVANDGTDNSMPALVSISINDLPNAQDDGGIGFITNPGVTFTTADVLANDDPGTEPSAITSFDDVSTEGGSVVAAGAGLFSYTSPPPGPFPAPAFVGDDTFTYTITDVDGDSSTATVTITVNNRVPTALDLSNSSVNEGLIAETVGTLTTTDPDVDTHIYSLVTGAGGDDNASFQIAGDLLQTAVALDASQTPTLSVRIQTDDQNGGTLEQVFTISVISTTANLSALTLTDVTLEPPFNPAGFNYTATVPFTTDSTEITPTAANGAAIIMVNGVIVPSGQSITVALAEGTNTVTITVTSEDGSTSQTYTIDVTRVSAAVFAQEAYIKASNAEAGDSFGYRLAITPDGNTLAVSTISEDSAAAGINGDQGDNALPDSGAVYVFSRDPAGIWTQQAYLKASNNNTLATADVGTSLDGLFGYRLTISADGNTLAVASTFESSSATGINGDQTNGDASGSGAAYIFVRDGIGIWTQQAYIKASNTARNDRFAQSIALSGDGNTLAAGARSEDSAATGINGDQLDNTASSSGAAYVFTFDGFAWSQQAYIKASNAESGDQFGMSVSLSGAGNTLVVTASAEDSVAVGVNGDQLDNSAAQSGAAYVFTRDGGSNWSQQAYLKASNTEAGDRLGSFGTTALSADGNTLAVGAQFEDSSDTGVDGNQGDNSAIDSGAVYVFARNGVLWAQQGYVKASNTDAGDGFGQQLSLSPDGARMVVGASQESSAAQGFNGTQADNSAGAAGAAYLFSRDGGNVWSQQDYIKASNAESFDQFGFGVALADNAMVISGLGEGSAAVGINGDQDDNSAAGSGAVYVFEIPADPADADLNDVMLSGVTLDQPFDMGLFNYTAMVSFTTTSTEITPTAVNGAATIMVNGTPVASGQSITVALDEGDNIITITVTSADGTVIQTYTITVTRLSAAVFAQSAYIKASNPDIEDHFAYRTVLSADGNTLAVSTQDEDSAAAMINGDQADNSLDSSGAVYVFTLDASGIWSQQAYIKPSNNNTPATVNGSFGYRLAMSADGDTLAVGARFESSATTGINGDDTNGDANIAGAAYVFVRNGTDWSQQAYIKASNTEGGDLFGRSIALSGDGNTLAVGADREDSAAMGIDGNQADNGSSHSGAAYVYTRSGVVWTQQAYIKASNPEDFDNFGQSIGLSGDGNTMAVSAPGEDSAATGIGGDQNDNSASGAGATYVYTRVGVTWSQQAYLKASNTGASDAMGAFATLSLSADGNTLAVGASAEDSAATGIDGDGNDDTATNSGAVYVFARDGGDLWTQEAFVKASNTDAGDQFGFRLAFSPDGNRLVVGAFLEDSSAQGIDGNQADNSAPDAGAAYLFGRASGSWSQLAYLKASNTEEFDNFGLSATLSANNLVAGGTNESSSVPGINGDQASNNGFGSGAVYVFSIGAPVAGNDTPLVLTLDTQNLLEAQAAGLVVGNFMTADSDSGDTHVYSLVQGAGDTDNASFQIAGNQLQTAAVLSAAPTPLQIRVSSDDQNGGTIEQVFQISVLAPNNAPTDIVIDPMDLPELAEGAIAILSTVDPDLNDAHAYTFVPGVGSDNNDLFSLSMFGELSAQLDALQTPTVNIRVQTDDTLGGLFEKNLTLNVIPSVLLSDLSLSGVTLDQVFAPTLLDYTATVPFGVSSTAVTPTTALVDGAIAVNGDFVASGGTSSPIALTEGVNIIDVEISNNNVGVRNYTITITRQPTDSIYAIGDTGPGGGQVFYIEPGSGGMAGLEVAPADLIDPLDLDNLVPWGCSGTFTGAFGLAVGAGATNTALIVADACSSVGNEAAEVAAAYSGGGFSDWFLPSQDELDLMYLNLHIQVPALGGFANDFYWSSSEIDGDSAWSQDFSNATPTDSSKNGGAGRVRAARAFGPTPTYAIGDTGPGGGLVFYIEPGSGGMAGLEAAPADQVDPLDLDPFMPWGCNGTVTGATGLAVGDGATNTAVIVADACSSVGNEAAEVAAAYNGGGFTDWFLPSQDELALMHLNLHNPPFGGFGNDGNYWSSSEFDNGFAWYQNVSGFQANTGKLNGLLVRAARAFGSAPTYAIGDTGPGGGLVFYIEPGSGGTAGLEAAPADLVDPLDLDNFMSWGCLGTVTGATGLAVGAGATNTALIVDDACSSVGNEAAEVAAAYNGGGFSDWLLPSRGELNLMYLNLHNQVTPLGGFASDFYQSSSEIDVDSAWSQDFSNATPTDSIKSAGGRVRAARAFGSAPTYAIGDTGPGGGLVFYIEPGSRGEVGLEAAPADLVDPLDLDNFMPWGCSGTVTGANGQDVGDGVTNTALIVADACSSVGNEAAEVAAAYNGGGFSDWFLPSLDELILMYSNLHNQMPPSGGFADFSYFSSSEESPIHARAWSFNGGFQTLSTRTSNLHARAARVFGPAVTYAIGDTGPGGGLVFYIEPGSLGLHGLEAAPVDLVDPLDLDNLMPWGCSFTATGATGLEVGDGATNTALIVADACSSVGNEAAEVAAAHNGGGFNDWFLPSRDELDLMYRNLHNQVPALGGFANGFYWSSSEFGGGQAWGQFFDSGGQDGGSKGIGVRVRAARAF